MDQECRRAFQYHAALPYGTETNESVLQELHEIVDELEILHNDGRFQVYEFGTEYAPEATLATKRLMSWIKRKLDIPLEIKLKLTKIFILECFRCVEPTLFVRYGTCIINLWSNSQGQQQIKQYFCGSSDAFNWLHFTDLGLMVRNVVVLGDVRPSDLIVRHPNRLSGLGGSTGAWKGPKKQPSPVEVALMLARQFVPIFHLNSGIIDFMNNEILVYLGTQGHTPLQSTVLSAFCALIPFADSSAYTRFTPLLFSLWNKVPIDTANRFILPAIAEFTVYNYTDFDLKFRWSDEELSTIFQRNLHSMQIPLISAQKASKHWKSYKANSSLQSEGGRGSDNNGAGITGGRNKTASAGSDASSFAKIVVWNLTTSDVRTLDLLANFTNAVMSFCHPSNIGVWTSLILSTLSEIVTSYTRRLNIERGELTSHSISADENIMLTPELTKRFVGIVMQPVMMSVYSNSGIVFTQAVGIVRMLAWLCPETIVNEVLSVVYPTLQHGLHQPQRLIASIACLEQLAVPLTSNPRFKMHLTTLLELTIPNMDTNDIKRCFLSMSLFQTIAALCEFKDISDDTCQAVATQILPLCVRGLEEGQHVEVNNEEAEAIVKGTSAIYPELMTIFIRRIFELLETSSEHKLGSAASTSVLRVLLACSEPIYNRMLDVTLTELSNPQQQSYDAFAQVCGSFVRANSFIAFPKMWKVLNSYIREEIFENQAGKKRVVTPRDSSLIRYLSVLNICLLAANPKLLVDICDELKDLLRVLRAETGPGVVYTVANTIHHTIVSLVSYSVLLPSPLGSYNKETTTASSCVSEAKFNNIKWNIPTKDTFEMAERIFREHFEISKYDIERCIEAASSNVQDGDILSSALIFIRTATGAVAPLVTEMHPGVIHIKAQIASLLLGIYPKISMDDVTTLKEILFVAKVWLCDNLYERTARLDSHQVSLYLYEKRQFEVPGNHKKGLPPVVLARRAQVYHHQRLSLATQHRKCDETSRKMIFEIVIDACFSAYPAVTRNAFSALYGPLKIFNEPDLYLQVYQIILERTNNLLDEKEYEKAEGGFGLLKYRSLGLQTVGKSPRYLLEFVRLCMRGVRADHRQLISLATQVFFVLLPDVLRIGITTKSIDESESWSHMLRLLDFLTSTPLDSQHWREALLRTSALLMITTCPQLPLNTKLMETLLNGLLVRHPDVRITAVLACINVLQGIFHNGMVGFDADFYQVAGKIEVPSIVKQSKDSTLLENDLSSFIKRSPLPVVKSLKSQPRPSPNLLKFSAQASEPEGGYWRIAYNGNDGNNVGHHCVINLSDEDHEKVAQALTSANTDRFWQCFLKLRRLEPRSEDDKLSKAAALLFRNLVCLSCLGFGTKADKVVDEILSHADLTDKNWHRVAAEALCGILMSFPFGKEDMMNNMVDRLLSNDVVSMISSENITYWTSALAFAVPNIDYRRLSGIVSRIESFSQPSTSSDFGGIKLSLRTALHTEIVSAISNRKDSLSSVSGCWEQWNHSLQTTRETAVEEVTTAVGSTMQWPRFMLLKDHNQPSDLHDIKLAVGTSVYLQHLYEFTSDKSDISLLGLTLNLLHVIGGNSWIDILISQAFPLLLRLSAVRDDPEILELVTQVFSELSITEFSGESLNKIVDLIISNVKSDQWHRRMRMILFMQSFFFNHLLVMSKFQRNKLTYLVIDALSDYQAEVRELAADTLSGIVRCSPPEEQNEYVDKLLDKLMRCISPRTPLVQRHASVLGLGALIVAFPYSSPPPSWIPVVLAAIASKAAGDSGIVGKSAKQVLSDFKKTRQDTWHIDQLSFSQDQLDDLDGVLWRNYFA